MNARLVMMAILAIGGLVLSEQQAAAQVNVTVFGRGGGASVTFGGAPRGSYYAGPGYLNNGWGYSPGGTGHIRTGYGGTGFAGPGYMLGNPSRGYNLGRGFSYGGTGHIRAQSFGTGRYRAR